MKIPFMKERRRRRRAGFDLPVRFRIYLPSCPDISSSYLPGQLHDLSQDGVALLTQAIHASSLHMFHPLATTSEQCLLEIRIPCPEGDLILHGNVIWYDRIEEEGPFLFRVGIRLLEQPKDLRGRIESSLREHRSTQQPAP